MSEYRGMSTPKPGWIARDNDGDLFWYSEEPIWVDEYGEWDYGGCDCDWLDRSLYPDLKPGECMQIIDAQEMRRAGAAFEAEAHRKILAELDAARARLQEAEGLLTLVADVIEEKEKRAYLREPDWNPEAHIEPITLQIKDARRIFDFLENGK